MWVGRAFDAWRSMPQRQTQHDDASLPQTPEETVSDEPELSMGTPLQAQTAVAEETVASSSPRSAMELPERELHSAPLSALVPTQNLWFGTLLSACWAQLRFPG